MNLTGGIILAYVILMAADAATVKPRVLSSKLSSDTDYSFQAIVIVDEVYACMATLITSQQLITVAHCVAHTIYTNPFEPTVKTVYPIHMSNEVKPIELPLHNSDVLPKVLVIFSTFAGIHINNETIPPLLIRIITNSLTVKECQNSFKSYTLIEEQVCIDINSDFQYGLMDMGAPMVDFIESTVFGIASGGCDNDQCEGMPKIFTKVSDYVPYILEELTYGIFNVSFLSPHPAINFVWPNKFVKHLTQPLH